MSNLVIFWSVLALCIAGYGYVSIFLLHKLKDPEYIFQSGFPAGMKLTHVELTYINSAMIMERNRRGELWVIVDQQCPHCIPSLNRFIKYVEDLKLIPVSIVIRDSQKESIQQLLNIYGKSLSYAIIEDDVLDSLELKFVPAYILLDKGRKVRFCEPYPNTILRYIEE